MSEEKKEISKEEIEKSKNEFNKLKNDADERFGKINEIIKSLEKKEKIPVKFKAFKYGSPRKARFFENKEDALDFIKGKIEKCGSMILQELGTGKITIYESDGSGGIRKVK